MADEPVAADPNPSPAAAPVVQPVVDPAAPVAAAPAGAAAEPAKPVIPEKYDFANLKLPDGIALNPALVDAISPILTKKGFTQEEANELVEAHGKALAEVSKADEAKREADFTEFMTQKVTEYQAQVRKEWGKDYDANLATAQKGMARIMSPAAKALLDETGLGNHPEFVKAFYAVGKMVSEDIPPNGQAPTGRDARSLYPNSSMNA